MVTLTSRAQPAITASTRPLPTPIMTTPEPVLAVVAACASPAPPAPGLGTTGVTVAQLRQQARATFGASRLPSSGRLIRDARKAELVAALAAAF